MRRIQKTIALAVNSLRLFALGLWMLVGIQFARGAEIRVFAAASLTDTLKQIAGAYESQSGDKIVFNFGASSFLARQIEAGAPADIFYSADEEKMDQLEAKGLIVKETRRSRLSNTLVIVISNDSSLRVNSAHDLGHSEFKRIALADPATVPAGIYAKSHLQKIDAWKAISAKVIPTDNVRAALAVVESGNADAAIVYKTDAAISKRTRVALEIPRDEGPAIRYPVALMRASKEPAARKFLDHLESAPAMAAFKRFGFVAADPRRD